MLGKWPPLVEARPAALRRAHRSRRLDRDRIDTPVSGCDRIFAEIHRARITGSLIIGAGPVMSAGSSSGRGFEWGRRAAHAP